MSKWKTRFFCDRASLYLIKVQNMDRQSSEREFKCGSSCVNGGGSVSDWKCGLAGRGLSVSARKTVVQMNKPRACIHSYFHCNTTTTIASICVLGYFHKLFPLKSRLLWAAGLFFQLVFFWSIINNIWLTLRCWGNSSIPEGRFSKWF